MPCVNGARSGAVAFRDRLAHVTDGHPPRQPSQPADSSPVRPLGAAGQT